MSQQDRIIELRDMALAVLKAQGQWQKVHNGARLLVFHGALFIAHRAFQKLPPVAAPARTKRKPMALPYGLDIFAGGKVLRLQWDNDDRIHIEAYRPGEWECELEKLVCAGAEFTGA